MFGPDQVYPATLTIDVRAAGVDHQAAAVHAWDGVEPGAVVVVPRALDWSAAAAEPYEAIGRALGAGWVVAIPLLTATRWASGAKLSRRERKWHAGNALDARLSIVQRAAQVSARLEPDHGLPLVFAHGEPPIGFGDAWDVVPPALVRAVLAVHRHGVAPRPRSYRLGVTATGWAQTVDQATRGGLAAVPRPWAPAASVSGTWWGV